MYQIKQTGAFAKWLSGLRDVRAKARILARLDSARLGNLGDVVTVGGGKSTQAKDIARAKVIAKAIE